MGREVYSWTQASGNLLRLLHAGSTLRKRNALIEKE